MPSVLIGLALLAFWLYCLFDAITTPEEDVRNVPKMLWVLIVVLIPVLGGLLWMMLGRPLSEQTVTRRRTAGRPRPSVPRGPDDDPDFLRDLDRRLRREDD
ncbi:PLD nuclease N-terminal domain-containing protein [Sphaerisporangium sp. TRM90804]|uniref:PLD nuclease N-terminal domain-containing protein n=1 Tax=Sphaerisporangium sp. TRM90804 TaxID=3031113 RepID=UPI002447A422|nr:PLD nuclease N-terminal domain-containing protein [Sphaerisporangium sp. TRM90804]MDH2426803.1 PLD nuclease N-terminal domain-containing protein [Sphaerisporangium sp. TRM90804]